MADSSVLLEVILEGKNIKVVQKQVDKAAESTNKLSRAQGKLNKSRSSYNKGEKGVAQATANSTKAFSKMRSEIGGGSSGLVAAYATLAANLFAATAAFNALRSASKVDQLTDGLDRIGIESGRNLTILADNLKEVTDNAISTEQALRATALATSAGFSDAQLKNLGTIAKGASIALGRDLGDALDRLVRGTAKLEPEILDELGIFVRLDDAVANYASSVGKSVDEITEFERRQAFLNEAIDKGIDKFASIAESAEANPYDKLGATFQNLAKEILSAVNTVAIPVLDVFANNALALGGAVTLFASTISKQMLPALADGATRLAENALAAKDNAVETSKNLVKQKESLKVYNQLIDKIDDGTAVQADFRSGLNSLDGSLATATTRLAKQAEATGKNSAAYKALQADINRVKAARLELLRVQRLQAVADAKEKVAIGISQLQKGQLALGFRNLTKAVLEYNTALNVTNVTNSRGIAIFNGLRTAVFGLATGLRVLATGFFALLGPLGLLLSIGPLVYDFLKERFFPEEIVPKLDDFKEGLERITETINFYSEALDSSSVDTAKFAKAISGTITTASEQVQAAFIEDSKASSELRRQLEENDNAIKNFRGTKAYIGRNADGTARFRGEYGKLIDKQRELQQSLEDYGKVGPRVLFTVQESVRQLQQEVKDGVTFIPEKSLQALKAAETAIMEGTGTYQDFQNALTAARGPFETYRAGLEGLEDKASDVRDTLTSLTKRTSTPFDELLEQTQSLAKGYSDAAAALDEIGASEKTAFKRSAALLDLRKKLSAAGLNIADPEDLKNFNTVLDNSLERQRQLPGEIKKAEAALNRVKIARAADAGILESQFEAEINLNNKRKELVQERLNTLDLIAEKTGLGKKEIEERETLQGELNKLQVEGLKLATADQEVAVQRVKDEEKLVRLSVKASKISRGILQTRLKIAEVQRKIDLANNDRDDSTPREQLSFFLAEKTAREKLIDEELKAKHEVILLEFNRQQAELMLLDARARIAGEELSNYEQIRDQITEVSKSASAAADEEAKLKRKNLELEEALLGKKIREERGITASRAGSDPVGSAKEREKEYKDILADATLAVAQIIEEFEKAGEKFTSITQLSLQQMLPFIEALTDTLTVAFQPLLDILEGLGPDGKYISSMVSGTLQMSQAFQDFAKGEDLTDKLSAVAGLLGAIGNIAQASADARVASIDREIDAEKKRDGASSQSRKKIQALEDKKEKEKKKAFETNKKISMAQAGIAALVAAMEAYKALAGIPIVGPTLAAAAAAAIGAVGAKTLQMIASTSYQGGGSSASAGGASLSIGERGSKVDVAQQATGSELAGLRGGDTTQIGGMPTSAFMGAKYRAEGGPTAGYVVGEQGPELFVPEMPGRIVPNDEMKQSQPLNVNFNVQAIDASSFNDALTTQRGNIISMIREAANTYGETFLEGVNDSAINAGGGKI